MRVITWIFTCLSLALLAGCSNPESRIAEHRAVFGKYSPEVQQKIRAGQVEVGFTQEMVLLSLGEPARKFIRKTATGEAEVWGYDDNRPQFSFGVGLGSGGRHSAMGGGVGISTGGYDPDEKVRVEFRAGVVTEVELLRP